MVCRFDVSLGYGVSSDLAAAREWYQKADAQDFPPAKLGLIDLELSVFGSCVAGCSKNSLFSLYRARYDPEQLKYGKKERRAVFRELVAEGERGDIEARILLGMCYERGIHVEENWDIALEWYRRAAVEGSEEGCALFARLSTAMEGESGAWDRLEARVVCTLARGRQQQGIEPAAQKKAIKWRLETAADGDRYACWRLHELYLLGLEVEENRKKSRKWLTRACEGHSDETVREYFQSVRPRITEVINEHSLDVALRSGPVGI
jgi:TPR repeat protein